MEDRVYVAGFRQVKLVSHFRRLSDDLERSIEPRREFLRLAFLVPRHGDPFCGEPYLVTGHEVVRFACHVFVPFGGLKCEETRVGEACVHSCRKLDT